MHQQISIHFRMCIKDVQAFIPVVFIFLCKRLIVRECRLMLMTVQFSFHSGANFFTDQMVEGGWEGEGMILLMKLFIFCKKIFRKQKSKPEVFLFIDRKLLSGYLSTVLCNCSSNLCGL
jgi:hypothetical protein